MNCGLDVDLVLAATSGEAPRSQWRDISPEASAEPTPHKVTIRVPDLHLALTRTAPALSGPCHATIVGMFHAGGQ